MTLIENHNLKPKYVSCGDIILPTIMFCVINMKSSSHKTLVSETFDTVTNSTDAHTLTLCAISFTRNFVLELNSKLSGGHELYTNGWNLGQANIKKF